METSSRLLLTFLLNACWQVALIAAVAVLCDRLLRDAPARYRHWLWMAALALSLCLPGLTSSHLFTITLSGWHPRQQSEAEPAVTVPITLPQEMASDAPLASSLTLSQKSTGAFIPIGRSLAATLVALYFLFLCYRGLKLFKAWRKTRAMARSVYAADFIEHVQASIRRCQTAIGVTRVRILYSDSITVPVTVGTLRPLIILPEHLSQESDADVLTSAIGHELVHVRRGDYLLNLICELVYLPLSFHPAAVLIRRRINQTRELSCDELVAEKLLDPEVYARSLVQLAGAAIPLRCPTTTITVGIADADILEERVMAMLRRPKTNVGRKSWLLIAATLCLVVPCVAAAPYALRISINSQDAAVTSRQSTAVEPVTLIAWLKKPGDMVEHGDAIAVVNTGNGRMEAVAKTSGVVEKLLVQLGEIVPAGAVLAIIRPQEPTIGWAVSTAQQEGRERNDLREERLKAQAELEAKRRAEQEIEGRVITLQTLEGTVTVQANTQDPRGEAREREERMLKEARMKGERARAEMESQDPELIAHRRAEREAMAKRQAELVKEARITMQQAIQIATNQYPGTVLESRLVREGPLHQASYIVTILSDNGAETTTTRVLMSAIDGSIINSLKQEQ